MGLYNKDNYLLGVAIGSIFPTIDTGIADGYSISFDNAGRADTPKGWYYAGPDDAKTRVDHIVVMVEIIPEVDGACMKEPSTATPGMTWTPQS